MSMPRAVKLAAAFAVCAIAAACSNTDAITGTAGLGGAGGAAGVGGAGEAATPGSPRDFAVNVGDRVFFDSDSTDLSPTAIATLDGQSQWLSRYPRYRILIEGHADERGTREYNFSLSARRAQTVRDYLGSRGVDAARMRTVAYGKERPVAVCNDISCWSQNRRAVTIPDGGPGV